MPDTNQEFLKATQTKRAPSGRLSSDCICP